MRHGTDTDGHSRVGHWSRADGVGHRTCTDWHGTTLGHCSSADGVGHRTCTEGHAPVCVGGQKTPCETHGVPCEMHGVTCERHGLSCDGWHAAVCVSGGQIGGCVGQKLPPSDGQNATV